IDPFAHGFTPMYKRVCSFLDCKRWEYNNGKFSKNLKQKRKSCGFLINFANRRACMPAGMQGSSMR
ncbi:hypothetical protein, partial [Barnesiella sp. CU968]|uniref:hypothetical protein n=1 Tax=Barnesiella sp. CU968 TaxID=2780099 RepID=UPI001957FE8F